MRKQRHLNTAQTNQPKVQAGVQHHTMENHKKEAEPSRRSHSPPAQKTQGRGKTKELTDCVIFPVKTK